MPAPLASRINHAIQCTYLIVLFELFALVAASAAIAEGRAVARQLDQMRGATAARGSAQFLDCVAMTCASTGLQVDAAHDQTRGQAIAAGADQRIARQEQAAGTAQQGPLMLPSAGAAPAEIADDRSTGTHGIDPSIGGSATAPAAGAGAMRGQGTMGSTA